MTDETPDLGIEKPKTKPKKRTPAPVMSKDVASRYVFDRLNIEPDIDDLFTRKMLDAQVVFLLKRGTVEAAIPTVQPVTSDGSLTSDHGTNPLVRVDASEGPSVVIEPAPKPKAEAKTPDQEEMSDEDFEKFFYEELEKVRAEQSEERRQAAIAELDDMVENRRL